ncbi:uncharacterized protein V1513DRAFT_449847 [Lipomyces chichibuensis]|uniref:uncharacterized protein n=1 Tax=Lipomyces chichibuensis TaxID=1546026 RepID=UPI003343071A
MLDWLFEGDTVDETTIDQKLLEEGIDLSIDPFPDSPGASAWAWKALPTFLTGTPLPLREAAKDGVKQEIPEEQIEDIDDDVIMRDATEVSIRHPPHLSLAGAAESLRSRLLRKLTSAATSSKADKENAGPATFIQRPADFKFTESAAREPWTPTIDTPTRKPVLKEPPVSILRTPGTAGTKKFVSFAPTQDLGSDGHSDHGDSYKSTTGRIRSGLPLNFPGKFPSPWTPKSVIDKLDLAETPVTSFALRRKIGENSSSNDATKPMLRTDSDIVQKQKITAEPSKRSKFSGDRSDENVDKKEMDKLYRPRRHSRQLKKLRFICDQVLENNQNLEILAAHKALTDIKARAGSGRPSTRSTGSATSADEVDPMYWKRKFEETEEKRLQLLEILEEVQKHSEHLTEFGQEQDRRIVELQRQLDEESRKGKETVQMVQALSKEMRSLKEKSAEVNRRRLNQLTENRSILNQGLGIKSQ